ncbi:hypothetical protein L208DRAFT_1295270, partial [Tricholoma matsutake]
TVEPLITHTPRWMAQGMGYEGLWVMRVSAQASFALSSFLRVLISNMVGKTMGFAHRWVWVMGYCGPMGYGMQFPVNQVGRQLQLWDIRGYGL